MVKLQIKHINVKKNQSVFRYKILILVQFDLGSDEKKNQFCKQIGNTDTKHIHFLIFT